MGLDAAVWADDENEHELAGVHVGNASHAYALRDEVAAMVEEYPLILGSVLYNGSHCGDEIAANQVQALETELRRMPDGSVDLNQFRAEFLELCEVALKHGRAITF